MSSAINGDTVVRSKSDLPPPRDRKMLRPVSPPLSNTPLHRFNYYIALAAVIFFAIYAWRITQWKAEAGSWWNLVLGKKPPAFRNVQSGAEGYNPPAGGSAGVKSSGASVEDRINELASALGMPSKDLASAIADAVREYVPPASISSIAASQTGEAVQWLVDPTHASDAEAESAVTATATRGLKAVASAFEAAVGLDEPPAEI